jgi:tetratricopeptide (TPR) repeat protein
MKLTWMEKYLADAERLIVEGRVDEGLNLLNNLLYEEPGYGGLHNHLGWAYFYYTQNVASAELHLKMAMKFDEADAAPYIHLSNLYLKHMRYTDAIACLKEALTKCNGKDIGLFRNLAQAYELNKEWSMAIRIYKEALSASLVDHEVHNLLASIKRCRRKRMSLFFGF